MLAAKLSSSMIERVDYDPAARRLIVIFCGGGRYFYHEVPSAIYEGLKEAGSAGRYFNAVIRDRYRCEPDPAQRRFRPSA